MSGCVLQDEPQITGPIYWLLLVQHGETQEDNTDPLSNKKDKDHGQQIQTNVKLNSAELKKNQLNISTSSVLTHFLFYTTAAGLTYAGGPASCLTTPEPPRCPQGLR